MLQAKIICQIVKTRFQLGELKAQPLNGQVKLAFLLEKEYMKNTKKKVFVLQFKLSLEAEVIRGQCYQHLRMFLRTFLVHKD